MTLNVRKGELAREYRSPCDVPLCLEHLQRLTGWFCCELVSRESADLTNDPEGTLRPKEFLVYTRDWPYMKPQLVHLFFWVIAVLLIEALLSFQCSLVLIYLIIK